MKYFKAEQHNDDRGQIYDATPEQYGIEGIKSVMFITGLKGSERGNHVHAKDTHYSLIVSGYVLYEWTQKDDPDHVRSLRLMSGDMVLSEAGEKHRFTFLTDGAFVAMATEARTQESYEKDLTRVTF